MITLALSISRIVLLSFLLLCWCLFRSHIPNDLNSIVTFSDFLVKSNIETQKSSQTRSSEISMTPIIDENDAISIYNRSIQTRKNSLQPCHVNWSNLIQRRNLSRLTTAKKLGLEAPTYQETLENLEKEKSLYADDFVEYAGFGFFYFLSIHTHTTCHTSTHMKNLVYIQHIVFATLRIRISYSAYFNLAT